MRLAVFPGSFHPPTRAHMALAEAALVHADRVVFVLPRAFPHKSYQGASLEQRVAMVEAACAGQFDVLVTEGGLFIEIARECRAHFGPAAEVFFICGRDAAERIAGWDYGEPGAFQKQLEEYGLLVASRQGAYTAPPECAGRILPLCIDTAHDDVSATEVRRRIAAGEPWEDLVPSAIVPLVRAIYGPADAQITSSRE